MRHGLKTLRVLPFRKMQCNTLTKG